MLWYFPAYIIFTEMWDGSTTSHVRVSRCLKTNGFPKGFVAISPLPQTPVNVTSSVVWHIP
uniref:Uncharacterized protein n=1 Tax=Arundo donax TaxID=35708 RepID=A0A0A9EPY8_ARUDO